jgi:hypothetical protein
MAVRFQKVRRQYDGRNRRRKAGSEKVAHTPQYFISQLRNPSPDHDRSVPSGTAARPKKFHLSWRGPLSRLSAGDGNGGADRATAQVFGKGNTR